MTPPDLLTIARAASASLRELFDGASVSAGQCLVLGCSTSVVLGAPPGTAGNVDVGRAIVETLWRECSANGLILAVQGCEHINRALVVPGEYASSRELVEVRIHPEANAGGAAAFSYYELLGVRAAVVEDLGRGAEFGLDVGGVLIGMHLRRDRVAVPVRITPRIGEASVIGARCRLKWVGGPRTHFLD